MRNYLYREVLNLSKCIHCDMGYQYKELEVEALCGRKGDDIIYCDVYERCREFDIKNECCITFWGIDTPEQFCNMHVKEYLKNSNKSICDFCKGKGYVNNTT